MGKKKAKKDSQAANLGFEATLWQAADKLRNNMDAAEYKHTVLGLIFLKYISDAFEELHSKLLAGEVSMKGQTQRMPTSTGLRTFSGFRQSAGSTCKTTSSNSPLVSWSMMPWTRRARQPAQGNAHQELRTTGTDKGVRRIDRSDRDHWSCTRESLQRHPWACV